MKNEKSNFRQKFLSHYYIHVMNDLTNYRSFNDSTLINHQGSATSSDGMNYEIDNLAWDGDLTDGDTFTINFLGLFSNGRPKLISATIDQQDICS